MIMNVQLSYSARSRMALTIVVALLLLMMASMAHPLAAQNAPPGQEANQDADGNYCFNYPLLCYDYSHCYLHQTAQF